MTIETLFNQMKELTEHSEKFFMNHHEYRGRNVVVFDYSLTIPANFDSQAALECRGSVFEVDENMNFVQCVCRPYEKFLNSHEYDYDGNQPLFENVKNVYGVDVRGSEDVRNLNVAYALDKLDGSIISAFDWYGELDMKSNSSLTSDYKWMALDMIKADQTLFDKSKQLTDQNYTVIYEMISSNPKYQIVLTYDVDRLIVTGVRHNNTGEYFSYQEMVDHFGSEYVVEKIDNWDWSDAVSKDNIEGYVLVTECGLRVKMKTEWYVMHHNTKENFLSTARHFWEAYINGDTDDVFLVIKGNPVLEDRFNDLLNKCDGLYTQIMEDGHNFYEENKELSNAEYFTKLKDHDFKHFMSSSYASLLKNTPHEKAAKTIDDKLLIKKNISRMGISEW
jgi:T4 RnlA family RNA ligase